MLGCDIAFFVTGILTIRQLIITPLPVGWLLLGMSALGISLVTFSLVGFYKEDLRKD